MIRPRFALTLCVFAGSAAAVAGCGDRGAEVLLVSDAGDLPQLRPTDGGAEDRTASDAVAVPALDVGQPPDTGGQGDTPSADDGQPPRAGAFGAPCLENGDCVDGWCVDSSEGPICTRTCIDECPAGFRCRSVTRTSPDVVFLCIPDVVALCNPCIADFQCAGGRCVEGDDGRFCTVSCDEQGCPGGFLCVPQDDGAICLPPSGTCACREGQEGVERLCTLSNTHGSCIGTEVCDPQRGFVGCDAPEAATEDCNGVDDDCDGLIDEDLGAARPCAASVGGVGTCLGEQVCRGTLGWVCDARQPAPEMCNGVDDDCDGETDEDFRRGPSYVHDEHCGACNVACTQGTSNAVRACDGTLSPPRCAVVECLPGFFRIDAFQCVPENATICQACGGDGDCLIPGARCLELGDGRFCGKPCEDALDCPAGFLCGADPGGVSGDRQCRPETGSCSCTAAGVGLQRGCTQTHTAPGQPATICSGTETCEADGWSGCALPADTCDGVDNDCDGAIDGAYRDEDGRYVDDAHCGKCGNDCTARELPAADGRCLLVDGVPSCGAACQPGFRDVNGSVDDGCECQHLSDVDAPDGVDRNCDGVDGDVARAVFVAKRGADDASGTLDDPVRTIQRGIDLASAAGGQDVYVATGLYAESVVLRAGVSIFGGYAPDFRARQVDVFETVILGVPATADLPATILARQIRRVAGSGAGGDTTVDGFVVFGQSARVTGASSYAVRLIGCDDRVHLRNNQILAGDGADGARGFPGTDGLGGQDGAAGIAAFDVGAAVCSVENPGGRGGQRTCGGVPVFGGAGGSAACPEFDESDSGSGCHTPNPLQRRGALEAGQPGFPLSDTGGDGGAAGYDAITSRFRLQGAAEDFACEDDVHENCGNCLLPSAGAVAGIDGHNGVPGAAGGAGAGCVDAGGSVVDGTWQGGPADDGVGGALGGGGGGGGAGGGVEARGCDQNGQGHHDLGGSGGGGGSGGCPGTGGTGGGSGGGSFGIFVVLVADGGLPIIADNVITRGRGGRGGDGGVGGVGGFGGLGGGGGAGGQPNTTFFCAGQGGRGGAGGAGGHGGGGGGGCGGPSYGVHVSGSSDGRDPATLVTDNTYRPGPSGAAGGLGGASLGISGARGADGLTGDANLD